MINTKIAEFIHAHGIITAIQKNIEEHLRQRIKESSLSLDFSPAEINALSVETGAVLLYLEPLEDHPEYSRLVVEIPHFNITYMPNERSQPQVLMQGSAIGHGKNAIDAIKRQISHQIPTTKLIIKT